MKKIENYNEVIGYFVRQIAKFSDKCQEIANKQLQGMKERKDPKLTMFGEDNCLKQLRDNLFYSSDKVAFVHYSDGTTQLYIGDKNEPNGDTIKVENWQFVKDKHKNAFVEMAHNIIEKYNFTLA